MSSSEYLDDAQRYEVYCSRYRITAWRDGAVYKTEHLETGWFPAEEVTGNRPGSTGIIYAAADDEFARTHMTIRVRKE